MCKICTTLKMGSGRLPHISSPRHFITKYDDIFDQKKVLIILSTLKAQFFIFSKKIGLLGVQKFLEVQNYTSEDYYFDESSPKNGKICAKYAQICAILEKKSERCAKYAQICGNMRSTYSLTQGIPK